MSGNNCLTVYYNRISNYKTKYQLKIAPLLCFTSDISIPATYNQHIACYM